MSLLFLVRHGETSWNVSRRLTGLTDISINHHGHAQALHVAEKLRIYPVSVAYTSELRRTHQTLAIVKTTLGLSDLKTVRLNQLNERDCGRYTGLYKTRIENTTLELLDKDWGYLPPEGESLAMVCGRVTSAFETEILPELMQGKNVLIVTHYNPMRLLQGHLDNIPMEQRGKIGVGNGDLIAYKIKNTDGRVIIARMHLKT